MSTLCEGLISFVMWAYLRKVANSHSFTSPSVSPKPSSSVDWNPTEYGIITYNHQLAQYNVIQCMLFSAYLASNLMAICMKNWNGQVHIVKVKSINTTTNEYTFILLLTVHAFVQHMQCHTGTSIWCYSAAVLKPCLWASISNMLVCNNKQIKATIQKSPNHV